MKKEQQEIDIKKIIYSHADILSISDEIVICNRFDPPEHLTQLDKIALDIIEYYDKIKTHPNAR